MNITLALFTLTIYFFLYISVVYQLRKICVKQIDNLENEVEDLFIVLQDSLDIEELYENHERQFLREVSRTDFKSLFKDFKRATLSWTILFSLFATPIIVFFTVLDKDSFEKSIGKGFTKSIRKKFVMRLIVEVKNRLDDKEFEDFLKGVFGGKN